MDYFYNPFLNFLKQSFFSHRLSMEELKFYMFH